MGSDLPTSSVFAHLLFQLTLPVWGATVTWLRLAYLVLFQLTLPVWGATTLAATHITIQ